MKWTNEDILLFLEEFRTEPSLWDPNHRDYKNRGAQNEAWQRIVEDLPFPATIEDLKRKKETLMGYYRIHSHKYKKSLQTGDTYKTSWFAFETMHSFLEPIYGCDQSGSTSNTQSSSPLLEHVKTESELSEDQEINVHCEIPTVETDFEPTRQDFSSSNRVFRRRTHFQPIHSPSLGSQRVIIKRAVDMTTAKRRRMEASGQFKAPSRELDEYDHFGSLIAAKIRKMDDFHQRETLMNAIHNLVFQTMMKNKNVNSTMKGVDPLK